MASEKAQNPLGVGLTAGRIWRLRRRELEKLPGHPRDEAFDGVGEDVGALAVGELKLDRHRAHAGDTVVHVGVPRWHWQTGRWSAPIDPVKWGARVTRAASAEAAKRSRTDEALGMDGTEAGMWASQRPHGFDYLTDDGFRLWPL